MSRVALVTGGGSGIGAAISRRLARDGFSLCITGRRREPLEQLAAEIGALTVVADTSKAPDMERTVLQVIERFGRLDALVCNAGTGGPGSVTEVAEDVWNRVFQTNLTGAFLACRSALPHIVQVKGAVVTISSLAGLRADPRSAAYCSSKAGLIMLTKCIALDYGRLGVRANCICPGWIRTPLADAEMSALEQRLGLSQEEAYARVTAHVPMARPGLPDEVAETVAWLASPQSSYINGAVITVDGGLDIVEPGTLAFW